jgi:hypothetical protein
MPAREINSQLGRNPTIALLEAGFRIEPRVSNPRPTTPKLAASPNPVPPEDPQSHRPYCRDCAQTGEHGIDVVNSTARPFGHCCFGEDDSARGPDSGNHSGSSLWDPAQQRGRTASRLQIGHVSLTKTGMPCRGPTNLPLDARAASSEAASASPAGLLMIIAPRAGPLRSYAAIRTRCAWQTDTALPDHSHSRRATPRSTSLLSGMMRPSCP